MGPGYDERFLLFHPDQTVLELVVCTIQPIPLLAMLGRFRVVRCGVGGSAG